VGGVRVFGAENKKDTRLDVFFVVQVTGLGPLYLSPRSAAAFSAFILKIGSVHYTSCAARFKSRHYLHQNKKDTRLDVFFVVQVTGLEPGYKHHKNRIKSGYIFICVIFRVIFY